MYIKPFLVNTTNIFPIANSTAGGQLLSEFNLRSRESVLTPREVKYMIGPSYTHDTDDFKVTVATQSVVEPGSSNANISGSGIVIAPGKALLNGHYVESLAEIAIDIAELNAALVAEGDDPLKGKLCIGLRVIYSTEQTMNGAMEKESDDGAYQGLAVVICPKAEFKLPTDVPEDPDQVVAHMKLAELTFQNGAVIANSIQNVDNSKAISADRIGDIEEMLDDTFVTRTGLDSKKLYVFAGADQTNWCEAIDSLMIWDNNPTLSNNVPPFNRATILSDPDNTELRMYIPHKQPDQPMFDSLGERQYYQPVVLTIPGADYATGSAGVVNKKYNEVIKSLAERLSAIYTNGFSKGSLRWFIPTLYADGSSEYPTIDAIRNLNINTWSRGDYILVGQDQHAYYDTSAMPTAPSTMYVVPGKVILGSAPSYSNNAGSGAMLSTVTLDTTFSQTTASAAWTDILAISSTASIYRGDVNDYFKIVDNTNAVKYLIVGSGNVSEAPTFLTDASGNPVPIWLTGGVPLAQVSSVGGFYNVPNTALGSGYVGLDSEGHLRLLDYDLLSTGVLAYQLGEDFTVPSGVTAIGTTDDDSSSINSILQDFVNDRVAFANAAHMYSAEDPSVINIYITLQREAEQATLHLGDIDSRFGTSIYVHFLGEADSNTILDIYNCEKIRLDFANLDMTYGTPTVRLDNCCLFYDSAVLNLVSSNNISGLTLWYDYSEGEPALIVDGLTVELADTPQTIGTFGSWSSGTPNDNHYSYALKGLTFSSNGEIIGMKFLISDDVTGNVAEGDYIFADLFTLPQSSDLIYPATKLSKQLKVTGRFITAYPLSTSNEEGYVIKATDFTVLSQSTEQQQGTISAYTTVKYTSNNYSTQLNSMQYIDGWQPGAFHVFDGGIFN